MSISKIILLLSPAVFQNLSHRKGFWVSAGTVMTITLMDMILNVIKCGGGTSDEHDPLEHTKTFMYELGMANDTFGEAVSKISLSENSGENNDVEDKCRAYFPTTKIIVIATFLLEIVKLILAILIDIRKTIQRKNRVANISKPSPTQLRPCSPQLNSSSLHLPSTTSSDPEDIATEILSHCSTVIYVRPAPDMSENVPAIVDTLPNIAETIELTDDNNFVVEDISPTIDETVPALDNTSPALDNTAPALDNTAPAALGYTVAALGHTAPALSQTAPALDNIAPALDNIAPALDNIPPALGHTAPALDNIAPDLSLTIADTSPTVADTSPTVANTSLTVADTSHTVADTSPTVANTSPTVADNSPSHTFMTEDSTPMTADNTAINVTATMISDAPDKGDKKAFTPLAETVLADEESSIFEGATNVNVEGMSLEETGAQANEKASSGRANLIDRNGSDKNTATIEVNAATREVNAALCVVHAATSERNAGTSEVNAATSEVIAATSEVNAANVEATARPINTTLNRERTISMVIKTSLRTIFFRTGTLSLIGGLICTVVWTHTLLQNAHFRFLQNLLIAVARYFAYFLPLVWILFDVNTRVYTLLKLRQILQRYIV